MPCKCRDENYSVSCHCHAQAGLDQVKWVDGGNCSANGVAGDVEDGEDIFDFDLLYFDATGFTAQTIIFPEAEIGGPYAMCCEFIPCVF